MESALQRRFAPGLPNSLEGIGPGVRACLALDGPESSGDFGGSCDLRDIEEDLPDILTNRLSPLALELVRRSGQVPDPDVYQALQDETFRCSISTTHLVAQTGPVLEALNRSHIKFLVMKGPAVAQFHPALAHRPYSDIDILVRPTDFERTVEILRGAGYFTSEESRPPWEWFRTTCIEGMNFQSQQGGAIDVHHHLPPWVFTKELSFDALYSSATPGEVGGVETLYLGAEHAFLVAALHVLNDLWKGDRSLLSWRDLVVLRRCLGRGGLESVFESASLRWLLPYVDETLAALCEPGDSAPGWFRLRYGPKYARLYALGWQRASLTARHPAGWALRLPALRGFAYLTGWLVPSSSFVRERHGGYIAYWQDLARSLRRVADGADLRSVPQRAASLLPYEHKVV
jgi:hypothetical protein